jgi:glycosyltransferase involved in cell wall biosynthesis
MHILYIHQYFSTPQGAAGLRSYEFAKALIEKGHEVTILCSSYSLSDTGLRKKNPKWNVRSGLVDGIRVIEYCLGYSNKFSFFKRTVIFLLFTFFGIYKSFQLHYDVLFATSTPLTVGIPGIVQKLLRRKTFVFEVRDLWPELPAAMGVITNPVILNLMSMLEWACYHSADYCIGLSPGMVDGIVRRGINRQKVTMIPNGADIDIFRPDVSRQEFGQFKMKKQEFYAIFSGTHGVANGLGAVIEAAKVLYLQNNKRIKIILIGQGKLRDDLIAQAKHENLENCIFLDPVPKKELAALQASCQVGLMILANIPAFYFGTSPNKFFDYLASGLPVLVNYPGWVADIITNHNCGIAVPPEDASALAQALCRMASNPENLSIMGKNSRALAETIFNRSVLASDFCALIERANQEKVKR